MNDIPLNGMMLYCYRATCTRVVDGDTIDLNIDLGLKVHVLERVRLFGVDTPETYGQKKDSKEYIAGKAATKFVEAAVLCRPLYVQTLKDKKGKYGRYLAKIWYQVDSEWVCLNDLLVKKGYAVEYFGGKR